MNREDCLSLLLAAYRGAGGTEEGCFAGDVLRACADGMARLWSMEIDGLERRAFVSTAEGDWLTRVCADRGAARREGETDGELRERTLRLLASTPASGNADHYRAWCEPVEGILRVAVLPLARGPGTVDIVAVGPGGRAAAPGAVAAAQAVVDRERPVGADARVMAALEVPLNVSARVALMDGASPEAVRAAFSDALGDYCREIALKTRTVSFARIIRLLLDCPGTADVTDFTLCGGEESLTLPGRAAAVPGEIELREAEA